MKKVIIIGTVASSILGFRRDLIKSLVLGGHSVYAFAMDYSDEQKCEVLGLGATPIEYKLSRSGMNPAKDMMTILQLKSLIKKIEPDVVFSYFSKPSIYGTIASSLAKVPRIVAMLEGLGYIFTDQPTGVSFKLKFLRKLQVLLYKLAFPLLDRLIFLNPDDPVDLVQKYNIKTKSISVLGGIGVNLSEYPLSTPPTNNVKFIFIGRLLAEKGIKDFINAAKVIKLTNSDVDFIVLGQIDDSNPGSISQEELDALIKSGIIIYPGQVDNVIKWLHESSVFVLPSYYREGVPRSTQEAMAIGRPVITTDVPGCRETVKHGFNGFLCPPHDHISIVRAMEKFLNDRALIEVMGAKSHSMAKENFDSNEVNKQLINMIIGD
ncbi:MULTISPECIES: glycosyltransferase family 4 protein [unclassified Pseudoalteromonas]|uniref:glycosyltransferase family 4 protein n=1 Tax=unclassified Pseudoalteromonas TaxID=194690 RepID=UPI00110A651F|nr:MULTISPECIES: glycosyltransferase family 4 protein [unclassified Pseudoalteromonas]TMP49541.1 glycosyltransferase family 1 protein [Pseudoalteromonas sp. S1650]TMP64427.1 glycosyltransferase family 1 protein [Pseudoalteromonas sp. S1649]